MKPHRKRFKQGDKVLVVRGDHVIRMRVQVSRRYSLSVHYIRVRDLVLNRREGIDWARGWDSETEQALRTLAAL